MKTTKEKKVSREISFFLNAKQLRFYVCSERTRKSFEIGLNLANIFSWGFFIQSSRPEMYKNIE